MRRGEFRYVPGQRRRMVLRKGTLSGGSLLKRIRNFFRSAGKRLVRNTKPLLKNIAADTIPLVANSLINAGLAKANQKGLPDELTNIGSNIGQDLTKNLAKSLKTKEKLGKNQQAISDYASDKVGSEILNRILKGNGVRGLSGNGVRGLGNGVSQIGGFLNKAPNQVGQ